MKLIEKGTVEIKALVIVKTKWDYRKKKSFKNKLKQFLQPQG